nr:hypothetical protein [Tanacetum cinerariifolium]
MTRKLYTSNRLNDSTLYAEYPTLMCNKHDDPLLKSDAMCQVLLSSPKFTNQVAEKSRPVRLQTMGCCRVGIGPDEGINWDESVSDSSNVKFYI